MYNFRHVVKDLYRGSHPSESDLYKLKKIGITKIVSLDKQVGESIDSICKKLNLKHVIIPINIEKKSILYLVRINLKRLLLSEPTYIHCLHGKDRTGFAIALLKVRYLGVSFNEAIKDAEKFGFGLGLDPHFVNTMKKIIMSFDKDSNKTDDGLTIVDESRDQSLMLNSPNMMNQLTYNTWGPDKSAPFGLSYRPYTYLEDKDIKPIDKDVANSMPQIGRVDNSYSNYGSGFIFDSNAYH